MNMVASGDIAVLNPPESSYGAASSLTRILIVDRERIERDVMTRRFTGLGYVCECCDNVATALEMLADKKFDLVLADTAIPENGINSFLSETLHIRPDAAIILATSIEDIGTAVSSLKDGASDWIIRPFSLEEIVLSVSRALEKQRLILENRNYQRTLEEQVSSRTSQLQEALKVLELTYHSTLIALGRALDCRDKDSAGRSQRVTAYARQLGQQLGLDKKEIHEIEQGALLHDIGKIGIPDALLRKRELTEEEQRLMHTHPEIGFKILSNIKFLEAAARLVLQSHEWYDGNGFPYGLRGERIALGARILAVADTFEDFTANIPGESVPATLSAIDVALQKLQKLSGNRLDPHLVEEFLRTPVAEWLRIRGDAFIRSRHTRLSQ